MVQVTKEQIDTLVELQAIDTKTTQIEAYLKEVPLKIEELDAHIDEFGQTVAEQETALSELKKKYRDDEAGVKANQDLIRKSNQKLPAVKTNKEYQAILKEIEELRKKNSRIEDEMLTALDKMEAEEKQLSEKNEAFEKLKQEIQQEKDSLQEAYQTEKEKLDALKSDWDKVSEKMDPQLLKRFLSVRAQTKNAAIVAAVNAVCQGCYMNIPPQMYNELQRIDSLKFCPHCHRIIYWKETTET